MAEESGNRLPNHEERLAALEDKAAACERCAETEKAVATFARKLDALDTALKAERERAGAAEAKAEKALAELSKALRCEPSAAGRRGR